MIKNEELTGKIINAGQNCHSELVSESAKEEMYG